MRQEPLITSATIVSAAAALLALLAAFGLPLTDAQQAAVLGLVGVAAPLAVAALARPRVTPTAALPAAPPAGIRRRRGQAPRIPPQH